MLSIVERVLRELGLVESSTTLGYYINITTGVSLSISAFMGNRQLFQIKASEFENLQPQYDSNCRAWADHPSFVPKPLGYRACDGWSIMVSEGVSHAIAHRTDVIPALWSGHGVLTGQLWGYFSEATHSSQPPESHSLRELIGSIQSHFAAGPLSPVAMSCIESAIAASVDRLAPRLQHGDFVFSNLGRAGRHLIVFDWEDYGRVELPGLDLFTLTLCLLDEDADALRALMNPRVQLGTRIESFLGPACTGQGLELPQFRRLVPFYLLVFLYLKGSYGLRVRERMAKLLSLIVSSGGPRTLVHSTQIAPRRH